MTDNADITDGLIWLNASRHDWCALIIIFIIILVIIIIFIYNCDFTAPASSRRGCATGGGGGGQPSRARCIGHGGTAVS